MKKRGRPLGSGKAGRLAVEGDLGIALAVLSQIADMDPMPGHAVPPDQLVLWAKNNAKATYDRLTKNPEEGNKP